MRIARETVRAAARLAPIAAALLATVPALATAAALTLSNPGAVTGGSVVAETSANTPALRLGLQASTGTITVSSIGVSIGAGVARVNVRALQLWADNDNSGTVTAGDTLLATGGWSPARSRYVFGGLSLPVTTTVKQLLVTVGVGVPYVNGSTYGAASSSTFAISAASADVAVDSPNTVNAGTITGTSFTIAANTIAEGSAIASSTAPVIAILNPGDGAAVSPTCATCAPANSFRVQVQVYSPGGAALSNVQLSTDNGTTWLATPALAVNANYASVVGTNAFVYEANLTACASGCNLTPGLYTLRARATNSGGANINSPAVVIAVAAAGEGDGNLLARDNSSQLCVDCHAIQSHSSQATDSKYGSWSTTCRDCHTPHRTTNVKLVKNAIAPPAVNGFQSARATNFGSRTGDSNLNVSSANFGSSSFTNADNSGPCQVCHTRTQSSGGLARWRNTGNSDTHYTAGAGTQACTGCHDHNKGFAGGGESTGGSACSGCHANLFNPMNLSSGGYHHYLNNANTGYPAVASIGGTTDANRKCVMCHVDHDVFRPDINTANGGRGKNLRTDINLTPTTSANFTSTDFDNALAKGGICLSCHSAAQTKSYAQTDGSTTTPALTQSVFNASTHNYAVPATFGGALTNTFNANCSKCHTDDTTKSKQTSAYPRQFGLHDSAQRRITHPLGDTVVAGTASATPSGTTLSDTTKTWTANQFAGYSVTITSASGSQTGVVASNTATQLTVVSSWSPAPSGATTYAIDDPAEERFCQNCHSGGLAGNDAYGVRAMSQDAKRFGQFLGVYGAGTISAATGSGTSTVTGTGTTWFFSGTGAAFTNGSATVTGITVANPSALVGWTLRNTTAGSINYSIVGYNSSTSTFVVSPSYREASGTGQGWSISMSDWYLRCNADANALWYRITSVASATSLTVYPSYPAACSGAYVARSAPGHPMGVTAGVHRPDEATASGWNGGGTTTRHVTCNDCHAVHAAQAGNHTPGSTSTANMAAANNGAWGVSVGYTAARSTTGTFTNASKTVTTAASFFLSTDVGKNLTGPDGVIYPITAYASGTSISIGATAGYKGASGSGTFTIEDAVTAPTFATVASLSTSNTQAQLCLKCHSPYGYGTNAPKTTFFDASGNGAAGTQTDVSKDFNPGQLSHHAVFAIGNNQPPATANPVWASSAGRKNATWAGGTNPSSGLDNNFVDGWGAKSIVTCADCHSSDSPEDPWGPHGSANQWLLKGINPNVTVTVTGGTVVKPNACYYKGSGSVVQGVVDTGDTKNLCLNCHRADVYGLVSSGGQSSGSSCNGTTMQTGIAYANFARVSHPVDANSNSNSTTASALTRWGIYCMQCHGGRSLGTIHGTNNLLGPAGGTSYEGKRFLTGAVWHGVTRATTGAGVKCYFSSGQDSQVNNCSHSHSGTTGNVANYDYDSGSD